VVGAVIGVIWSVILTVDGDPNMSLAAVWIGGFLVGALNGAAGVFLARVMVTAIGMVIHRLMAKADKDRWNASGSLLLPPRLRHWHYSVPRTSSQKLSLRIVRP
jgi:hypothetical protein